MNGFYVVMSCWIKILEFVGVKVEKNPDIIKKMFAKLQKQKPPDTETKQKEEPKERATASEPVVPAEPIECDTHNMIWTTQAMYSNGSCLHLHKTKEKS